MPQQPRRLLQPGQRLVPIVLLAGCVLVALILAFDLLPFLRGGFGWQWPYNPAFGRALVLIVPLLVYTIAGLRLLNARLRWAVAWSFVGVIALSLAALLLRGDDALYLLFTRTVSPLVTGNHFAAANILWEAGTWREWSALMVEYEPLIAHVPLAPPGLPILYQAVNEALATTPSLAEALRDPLFAYQCHNYTMLTYSAAEWASAWVGILLPVWSAFAVFPLLAVARRMLVDEGVRWALLLFPLLPSLLAFAGVWNTVYPLLSLLAFWALGRGIAALGWRQVVWSGAAGWVFGLATFINFAFVPLALLFGLHVLLNYALVQRGQGKPFSTTLLMGVGFGIGASLIWIAYFFATTHTPWELLAASFGRHFRLDYPYLPWLWLNFWDWALWSGLPLVVFWMAGIVLFVWRSRQDDVDEGNRHPVLGISLLLTLAILLVGNFARGETGRVWMLFTPFLLLAAVDGFSRFQPNLKLWPLLAAQAVWCAAVLLVLVGVGDSSVPPPPPPAVQTAARAADADFGGLFRLVGWDAATANNEVSLTLNWQAERRDVRPFYFSALLVSPDGAAQPPAAVWQPDDTRYPTTCWPLDQVISDHITLPLPADAPPGSWYISLAAFADERAEARLPVFTPDTPEGDQVGLGPVMVE